MGWLPPELSQEFYFLVKTQSWDQQIKYTKKVDRNFGGQFSQCSRIWKKLCQKSPKCMMFWLIACLIHSETRFSGQKAIQGAKNKVNWNIRTELGFLAEKNRFFFWLFWVPLVSYRFSGLPRSKKIKNYEFYKKKNGNTKIAASSQKLCT